MRHPRAHPTGKLPKCPTGIRGLDAITDGGLPRGRPSLICGGPGSGKTLFAMEFLARGARDLGEPGVFVSFEERVPDLIANTASLGFDLKTLERRKKVALDYIHIEKAEIEETGEYDLEGLFIRLDQAVKSVGAKRMVLDTIEALFSGFSNTMILRAELRRLFYWIKNRGLTAAITGERGEGALTRHGIEEYVSDCVILLDHRVKDDVSTRSLRIVKYRGSKHGTNEYPFLIDEEGISVLPITSIGLEHEVSDERVSSGVDRLDAMLSGKGYYRGSTILVSGMAGTGKTSLAASFADATCRRGERCLFLSFEESPSQIERNMGSIGIDLARHARRGLLTFHAARPSIHGLELHLVTLLKLIEDVRPSAVVIDPVSNLSSIGASHAVKSTLVRMIDHLKGKGITTLLTSLTHGGDPLEATAVDVSSLVDTWILLRVIETNGERTRGLYVLKSRGMPHSSQIREFQLNARGIQLTDVYLGSAGVLTGTARIVRETQDKVEAEALREEIRRRERLIATRQRAAESQIESIRAQAAAQEDELRREITLARLRQETADAARAAMAKARSADRRAGMESPNGGRKSDGKHPEKASA